MSYLIVLASWDLLQIKFFLLFSQVDSWTFFFVSSFLPGAQTWNLLTPMFLSYYRLVSFIFVLPFHSFYYHPNGASLVAQTVKRLPIMPETGFSLWVRKIPWRRKWQPTPVFLPGKSHGERSPGGLQSMGLQRVGHYWASDEFKTYFR